MIGNIYEQVNEEILKNTYCLGKGFGTSVPLWVCHYLYLSTYASTQKLSEYHSFGYLLKTNYKGMPDEIIDFELNVKYLFPLNI